MKEVSLDEPNPSSKPDEFVWIGLEEPTAEELQAVERRYGLHPLAVEDAMNARQQPKLEVYGEQLFIVARTAQLRGDIIEFGETAIFVGRNHIISVRHGSARRHTPLRRQLESAPGMLANGVDYVLHGILDFIIDGYVPILETIEEEAMALEQRATVSFLSRPDISRLFQLRRELFRFQRVLEQMSEVCAKLVRLDLPAIDSNARPYFRDAQDHVTRSASRAEALQDVLRAIFEISTLFEQQRQGATTRQLAAWAAILAVPTAIAGIYGMNFEHMPELKSEYGYFVVLAVISIICASLYVQFKRVGWL